MLKSEQEVEVGVGRAVSRGLLNRGPAFSKPHESFCTESARFVSLTVFLWS